jgi:hypothetical protein
MTFLIKVVTSLIRFPKRDKDLSHFMVIRLFMASPRINKILIQTTKKGSLTPSLPQLTSMMDKLYNNPH